MARAPVPKPDPPVTSQTLLLIPTPLEAQRLAQAGPWPPGVRVECCGFGPVAAAARTAQLLAAHSPARVLLVGIAGSYDPQALPVGQAQAFAQVALDGVGAGEGAEFLGPAQMFPQWSPEDGSEPVVDRLELLLPAEFAGPTTALLVSACAAAGSQAQAETRRARHPGALAEDMEAFSVAFACRLAGVPCGVVRGVSNAVGQRDPVSWSIDPALDAAYRLALDWIEAATR